MSKIIKTFTGYSGSQIFLIDDATRLFVRKIGDTHRNLERMQSLIDNYPVPRIYNSEDDVLDMEYIHGLDINTYLRSHQPNNLIQFLIDLLNKFASTTILKDYTCTYITKLQQIEFTDEFHFTKQELLDKLPKVLPSSVYHGDLSLDNMIYSEDRGFYIIDCITSEYDSYIFDIAKLRQDLECGWFTRNDVTKLEIKTNHIQTVLLSQYPSANDNYLLILMLLRVYRYSTPDSTEHSILLEEINRLWK